MRDKKVLIIAYYFPPLGMGGVQRVTKFVKYLPLFGWKPYVMTIRKVGYMAKDPSLLDDIPGQARIVRTGSLDPLRIWWILKKTLTAEPGRSRPLKADLMPGGALLSWLLFPDNKVGWIPFALRKGLSLCRREGIDLIFSSSPPPSLHLTGYLIRRLAGIPWVADFRDPWIGYKQQSFPTALHLLLKRKLQRLIIDHAHQVLVANPAIQAEFKKDFPHAGNIRLVDQGYDQEDFEGMAPASGSGTFTIGYLGTFSPDCDPEPVLAALRELTDQKLVPIEKIKLLHVGLSLRMNLERLIQKYHLQEVFEGKGYLPHRQALIQIRSCSVFVLVTSDDPRVFPAKVYEYLPFGKPILSVAPKESEVGRMMSGMGLGPVISPKDLSGIKDALLFYYKKYLEGNLQANVDKEQVGRFRRRVQTERLASIFTEIV